MRALALLAALAMLTGMPAAVAEADTIIISEELPPVEELGPAECVAEALPEDTPAPEAQLAADATPEPQGPDGAPDPWYNPMPTAPEPELRGESAEPELLAEEGWRYDADARELVVVYAPDAQGFVLCWAFDGDALLYRVEIAPEGDETPIVETECAEPCLALTIADYAGDAYRLRICAVLEDGSERTGTYSFRLEEAAAEAAEPVEADAPDGMDERVEQVLAQGDVIVTGRMPIGAELTAAAVPTEDLTDYAGAGRTIIFAYEISISANGQAFVPEEPLSLTVALNEVGVSNLDVLLLSDAEGTRSAQTLAEDVPVGSAIEFSTSRLGVIFGAAEVQVKPSGADYLLASNSIRIYSQGSRDYIGMTSCLQQYGLQRAGCGVFAVAHALQWMGCDNWTGLDDFLEQIQNLTHPADFGYAFAEGVNALYPDFTLGAISPNEGAERYYSNLRALFAAGGCGMFSYEGHYILVIGFSSDGSKIHVIDSSTGSTLGHMDRYHAYYCDPLAKQWVTISPVQNGAWDVPGRYSSSGTWEEMKSYGREYWVDREYIYYGNQSWYGGVPMITFTPGAARPHRLFTTVGRESCVYEMTGFATLRAEPFDSAEAVEALQKGDRIVSAELVDNGRDYWLRIGEKIGADGARVAYESAFIYAGFDNGGQSGGNPRFELVESRANLAWTEGNIDGTAISGTTSVTGTICCANRMTKITAEFFRDGVRWGDAVSVTPTANRQYEYALHGSTLDTGLRFAALPNGEYQLVFTVDYSYNCNQSAGRETISASFTRLNSTVEQTGGPWVYRVLAEGGLNMRTDAQTGAELVATLWSPTTVSVSRKLEADGYTWGYGTADSGETGWIVVDNTWTELLDAT